jgi:hypothetical protein
VNRPVRIVSVSLYCSAGIGSAGTGPGAPGALAGFDPVAAGLPRKHLKTMTRAVQLGFAAVSAALAGYPAWAEVPPPRRGLYVGASPQSGDPEDLAGALAAMADSSIGAFARDAVPLVPPLWLVKGLSNNVLGYASAHHDLQGDNGNWCDGRLGGSVALCAAVHAVAEGRVDLAIAGGAECLVGADAVLGRAGGEGAAFVVLVPGEGPGRVRAGTPRDDAPDEGLGELGPAAVPVALARRWLRGERLGDIGGLVLGGS